MDKKGKIIKEKLSPENFLSQFSHKKTSLKPSNLSLTTSHVSDAMRNITHQNGVLEGLKPVKNSFKIMGKAITVKTSAYDWGTVIKGIYSAEKGDILVICCDNDNTAVWGEMASNTAQIQRLGGTVIYGASRDITGVKKVGYPVFSRNVIPNAGKPLAEGNINIPIICGETTIYPGDLIVGDECGVVSVPYEIVDKVLKEAYKIFVNEEDLVFQLQNGKSFLDILDKY
ncbi:MAG: RraA family protein [Methanobacterium sp.]|nr:RraA family protein [Methanobacterium sp.]